MRLFLLALLVVVSGIWGFKEHLIDSQQQQASHVTPLLEEELTNVSLTRFNKQGEASQIVNVENWQQFKGKESIELINPKLILTQTDQSWTILSKQGIAYANTKSGPLKKVILQDDVKIIYENKNQLKSDGWELNTQTLSLHPDKHFAITDDEVTILGNQYILKAKGMHADLSKENILFNNTVTGEFKYGIN